VKDSNGQNLAAIYYEEEAGWRSLAKLLTRDEARRVAANVVRLPKLLIRWDPRVQLNVHSVFSALVAAISLVSV
jgi:hypothetical protein